MVPMNGKFFDKGPAKSDCVSSKFYYPVDRA